MTSSPTLLLKLGAIAFAALWAGWMMLSSGTQDLASITILVVCAALAGYAWYRMMRCSFGHMMQRAESEE